MPESFENFENFDPVGRHFGAMKFPLDLADKGRPFINFSCTPAAFDEPVASINLPLVGSISYGDGGQYGTLDLGNLDVVTELIATGFQEGASRMFERAQEQFTGEIEKVGALGAGILLAKKLGAQQTADALSFRGKQAKNPRTNTLFQGNMIRSFQFNFKMIGRNREEVAEIDRIQNTFREKSYASRKNIFMLQYPDTWTIKFLDPRDGYAGQELDYMPKIYTSYLTAVTTTINSSSNTFRHDMSPHEVDVSLQFQETKVLNREEIVALEDGIRIDTAQEASNYLIDGSEETVKSNLTKLNNAKSRIDFDVYKTAEKALSDARKERKEEERAANNNN